jgi:uncharacterized protein
LNYLLCGAYAPRAPSRSSFHLKFEIHLLPPFDPLLGFLPARGPDRERLDHVRAWARGQLARRIPPILLSLTHVDQLRPAAEWTPPYDVTAPTGGKARAIRAAMDAAARTLDLPVAALVPVAMPPRHPPYNLDALWARIALELDEAKLVQLDRLRIGQKRLSLRTLADQLGLAGRAIVKGIIEA